MDFSDRMAGLRLAQRYLSAGEWALAKIAAVQLRMPDLPDAAAVSRLRKAEELLRFNPNHYPAGSGRGGQFAPSDQSAGTITVADSSVDDITRRKFGSDKDAARSALKHFYEASRRARAEYTGVIYRDKDGSYGSVCWEDPFRGRSGRTLMQAPSLPAQSRQLLTLGFVVVLGSCASPPARQIDLDHAVAIANDSVKGSFGPKGPLRVLIATEQDVRSVRRSFDGNAEPPYKESVRNKISGRRLYVIRYPLPPVTLEDGDINIVGGEPCVLIDQDTGEVLGKFPD